MGLLNRLTGPYIYLDANIFIYALEAYPEYIGELTLLFRAIDEGRFQAVTSELTLAEALVKPFLDGSEEHRAQYEQAIQNTASLHVVPVNRRVLTEASRLRATTGLRLPDAIHAATSVLGSCETFLTNDRHFRGVSGLPVVVLSEILQI